MHRVRAFKTKHTYKLYVKLTHLTYMFFSPFTILGSLMEDLF